MADDLESNDELHTSLLNEDGDMINSGNSNKHRAILITAVILGCVGTALVASNANRPPTFHKPSKDRHQAIRTQFFDDGVELGDTPPRHVGTIQGNSAWLEFGYCSDVSNNAEWLVASSPKYGAAQGVLYLFQSTDKGQTYTLKDTKYGPGANSYFGQSCTIDDDGTNLVIGAPQDSNYKGCAYVYTISQDAGLMQQGQKLCGDGTFDEFGASVSIIADSYNVNEGVKRLAIGAPRSTTYSSGYVRIYESKFGYWQQIGVDISDNGGSAQTRFGASVALGDDGQNVIVGAPGSNKAYAYRFQAQYWSTIGAPFSHGAYGAGCGTSVGITLAGQRVVSGCSYNEEVKFWKWEKSMGWLALPSLYGNKGFGTSLSLSAHGTSIVIGNPIAGSASNGQAKFFMFTGSYYALAAQEDGPANSNTGAHVANSPDGSTFTCGCPRASPNGKYSGVVTIYSKPPETVR